MPVVPSGPGHTASGLGSPRGRGVVTRSVARQPPARTDVTPRLGYRLDTVRDDVTVTRDWEIET